ncbi:MAG: biotin--[acetyl-CoA-carboxylase] ligase [Ruminococcus sp.]|nr:biotin--[acetyl-CoA-carboxylase] ligase [Ruminococcus sp.]
MNVRDSLLKAFAEAGKDYISGSALAEKLGVSRNAVWKAVKALESEGYIIDSVTAKGYRLSKDSNHLSEHLISSKLTASVLGKRIIVLDEIDSTNNYAKELTAKDKSNGTIIVADRQTAGKGRMGRSFVSPSGKGLYMSVILRPEFSLHIAPLITSAVAVAVAEAIESLCDTDISIKWVNDLYLNGKKICGILTEGSMDMEMRAMDIAVIGIGINVRSVEGCFDEELSKRASSIEDETGIVIDRNALCAAVINYIDIYLNRIENRSYLREYRRRELLTGNEITANVGNETITGKAVGIDRNANLMVELENGIVRSLSSGEANLCRIKQS